MRIPIDFKQNIKTRYDKFGYLFIDKDDNKLKVKRQNEFIEFGNNIKIKCLKITGQQPEDNMPIINGDYYEVTGEEIPQGIQELVTPLNYPVYTNGFGSFLFVYNSNGTSDSYNIGYAYGNNGSQVKYFYIKSSDVLNPVGGSSSYLALSGVGWSGTVSVYQEDDGSNGDDGGSTDEPDNNTSDVTAPVLHFESQEDPAYPGSMPSKDADGDYYLVDPTATGWHRVWKHESKEYYISATNDGMDDQWQISSVPMNYPNITTGGTFYAFIIAYNYPDPWTDGDPMRWHTATWGGDYCSIVITMTMGPSGDDSVEATQSYLLVSGFQPSNFGGSGTTLDPNGKYYLQDETATSYNRIWISEDQNFKIYDSSKSNGYWYIDSNIDGLSLGESVYPDGAPSSPYNENDGSSLVWYSMGSIINGASVTLVRRSNNSENEGDSIIGASYYVTGAGSKEANGAYYATGEYYEGQTDHPIYKNKNDIYLYTTNIFTIISKSLSENEMSKLYYSVEGYGTLVTGDWTNASYPELGSYGISPYPTVTEV